jgi:FKBP-type peptidyl-prolyl cis-trans isomerase (trigger factor)
MERIKEGAIIKYPPQVVDHEVEHVMEDLKSRLVDQNIDMATYLKSREMEEEKFVAEEARPIAIKRLERSLVMDEIAKLEKIEVSQEMLQSSFQQTWGEYQGDTGFQKMTRGKSQPPKQLMNAVAMESANRAYVQQTLNRLKDIATGEAPELISETTASQGIKAEKAFAKKSTTRKKSLSEKKPARKTTLAGKTSLKAKKPTENHKEIGASPASPEGNITTENK